jgi:hypothetical protein
VSAAESTEAPTVVLCAGGPVLVRGDAVIETEDGVRHRTTRPVSAVCRCGATSRAPWCDGTHKLLPRSKPVRPPG